jgi:hypothetical protein
MLVQLVDVVAEISQHVVPDLIRFVDITLLFFQKKIRSSLNGWLFVLLTRYRENCAGGSVGFRCTGARRYSTVPCLLCWFSFFFRCKFLGFSGLDRPTSKINFFWRRKFDKNKIKISMTSYNQFYAIFSAKFH